MSGGANGKKPNYGPEGGPGIGGQYPMTPPQMVTGGPYGPGPSGVPPQLGQVGNPAQMGAWKNQFSNWNPGQGQLQNQLGGLLGGGQQPQRRFPGMNIPGLLAGGGGGQNPAGFPGYANLPKNWQDEGYSWNDPNNPGLKHNIIA